MRFLLDLFKTDFMPHGHCYFWRPDVLWTNVIGDLLIAVSYFTIPFLLYYFIRRRKDSKNYAGIFLLFALFIFGCGTTHVLSVVSVWTPVYRLEGLLKLFTAIISLYTAYRLYRILPVALNIPSVKDMETKNKELKSVNEALQHKTAELAEQNKFLGKLAFATYHDLREPVRGMSMNSQLLLHKYAHNLDEDAIQILQRIADEGKRMYGSVDSILKFTFLESETFVTEQVNLARVMALVEKNLSQQIRESFASIKYTKLPTMVGNERLYIILFENLLSNSINFHSDQPPLIQLAYMDECDYHVITVSDNGTGFDNQYREKIFEMFQRLGNNNESYRGAGLGLALCRRIVEIFGGTISADSAEGMGTVITIRLPKKILDI